MKIEVNSLVASQLPPDRGAKQISNCDLAGMQGATQDRPTFHSDSTSVQALTSQALKSPEIRQAKLCLKIQPYGVCCTTGPNYIGHAST